jgi:cytochrome c-type biogenesis protein CcsB
MASAYEFTLCFAAAVTLAWLGMQIWTGKQDGGAFVLPIALALLLYGLSMPPAARQVRPLVPALNSIWFQVHVTISALAYGAFAVTAGGGVMYLLRSRLVRDSAIAEGELAVSGQPASQLWHARPNNPGSQDSWERKAELLMWRGVAVGFPLMTAAMLTGAIWAQLSWGRYWGWDLKEIWALLIWLVYLVYLHARAVRGWHGRPLALLTLLGFAVVLFTFLGTGWLARKVGLESLHVF